MYSGVGLSEVVAGNRWAMIATTDRLFHRWRSKFRTHYDDGWYQGGRGATARMPDRAGLSMLSLSEKEGQQTAIDGRTEHRLPPLVVSSDLQWCWLLTVLFCDSRRS